MKDKELIEAENNNGNRDLTENSTTNNTNNDNNSETIKNIEKMSPYDKEALDLVRRNPNITNYRIGKTLKSLGLSNSTKTIYSRLKQSDYLSTEIDKVRQHHHEMMSREITPLALKIHKKVLKSKDIDDKEKLPWVQLAEKVEFRYDAPVKVGHISVETLNFLQQSIAADLAQDSED